MVWGWINVYYKSTRVFTNWKNTPNSDLGMPKLTSTKRKRSFDICSGHEEGSGDNIEILSREGKDMDCEDSEAFNTSVLDYYEEENRRSGTKFNEAMNTFVVGCMVEEVDSGRAPNGAFNKNTWSRIQKSFNRKFKTTYTEKQISALHRRLKDDYKTRQHLITHTGFGWCDKKKVPTAPHETWVREQNIRHNVMKFSKYPLAHQDELHKVFAASIATGKYTCNSTQVDLSDDDEDDTQPGTNHDGAGGPSEEVSTDTRSTGSRKKKGYVQPGSLNASRKKKGRKDYFDDAMQAISDSSVWRCEKDKAIAKLAEHNTSPADTDPESILALMIQLKQEAGIDANSLTDAAGSMRDVYNRRLFKAMDDEHRIAYMRKFRFSGQPQLNPNPVPISPPIYGGHDIFQSRGPTYLTGDGQQVFGAANQGGGFGSGYVGGYFHGYGIPGHPEFGQGSAALGVPGHSGFGHTSAMRVRENGSPRFTHSHPGTEQAEPKGPNSLGGSGQGESGRSHFDAEWNPFA